jgi:hypothetical protein
VTTVSTRGDASLTRRAVRDSGQVTTVTAIGATSVVVGLLEGGQRKPAFSLARPVD